MAKVNPHFQKLKREYIFPIIEKKLEELQRAHPQASIINLGIGDVAKPLAPSLVKALCQATEEMGKMESIRGYGPSEGYFFLREALPPSFCASEKPSLRRSYVLPLHREKHARLLGAAARQDTPGTVHPQKNVAFPGRCTPGRRRREN